MTTPNKKPNNNSATTILITTASVMAAITGWAIFANNDSASQAPAITDIAAAPAIVTTVALKPLPTIVPLTGVTPQANQVAPTVQPKASTVQQPARNVNPAPRPLTRSRSSR